MNVVFFDLETQFLYRDLGMLDRSRRDQAKLKLAVSGKDGEVVRHCEKIRL